MLNNIVFIIFDSCRYDAFVKARTPNIDRIGNTECRLSYASWTSPSHYTYLMGMIPYKKNLKGVFASQVYRNDFQLWSKRIGRENIEFKNFVPQLSLVSFLKQLGYKSYGYVSLPVLNHTTSMSCFFDHYELMEEHNHLAAIFEKISFSDTPSFYFINTGETHYPYILPNESDVSLPKISGVHGVFKTLDDFLKNPSQFLSETKQEQFFHPEQFVQFYNKTITNIEYLDRLIGMFFEKCPKNTYFIITSDHGELFGEDGYFGHGPIMHEKVFEVPFIEGMIL